MNFIKKHKVVLSILILILIVIVLIFIKRSYIPVVIYDAIKATGCYLLLLNIFLIIVQKCSKEFVKQKGNRHKIRNDEFNIIFFIYSAIIVFLVGILLMQIFENFLKDPQQELEVNLLVYMVSTIFTIWPWFFYYCFWECKSVIPQKKISPKFWTKLIKVILVAVIAFVLIQTNINENICNNSYPKNVNLLNSKRFARELPYVIAYVLSGIATLYYPMLDMYEYTRDMIDKGNTIHSNH